MSRSQAAATLADEPPRLTEKFLQGNVADASLGAYAEHLAEKIGVPAPKWSFALWRIAAEPIFDEGGDSPTLRSLALAKPPPAFKRRNIFTPSVDLPLSLPAESAAVTRPPWPNVLSAEQSAAILRDSQGM